MNEVPGPNKHNIERGVLKKRAGPGLQDRIFNGESSIEPENPDKSREVIGFPRLFSSDHRIRYNQEGDVFIVSYRERGEGYLTRWSTYPDIETAIRGAEHVREKYNIPNGEEIGKVRNVIGLVKDLSVNLQERGIAPLDMRSMAEYAAEALVQSGFDTAVKPKKIQIMEKIMSATDLDKRNRVNPSRSRLILSHAWVDLIQELLVGRRIEEKFGSVREKLIRSREFQCFLLSQAVEYIDEAVGQRTGHHEEERTIGELKTFARDYLSSQFINTKPYSQVAAISRFLITHTGTQEELIALSRYIGDNAQIFEGTPRFSHLGGGDKKRRLLQISKAITGVLKDGENALSPKEIR